MLYVTGPGHGGPGLVANTYLEGTYTELYPPITEDEEGLRRLFRQFSFPGGIPSHVAPETPGSIHEGGELGYALSHAFGAAFDNPDLLVACVVGDGEAETGPLATSWHSNKFLDPATDGAVLPDPPPERLEDRQPDGAGPDPRARAARALRGLRLGAAHRRRRRAGGRPPGAGRRALDAALDEIAAIQEAARERGERARPRWPLLVLRTPKGWTGPHEVDGKQVEGTWRSHQVPLTAARGRPRPPAPARGVDAQLPARGALRRAGRPRARAQGARAAGGAPDGGEPARQRRRRRSATSGSPTSGATRSRCRSRASARASRRASSARSSATWSRRTPTTSGIFGPDETASNRLDAVFEATGKAWVAETTAASTSRSLPDGRVMEVLSEHQCQGWLEGYLLTGRHGLFNCYEAFIHIVDSMFNQHAKWLKVTRGIPWRRPLPSLNYLLSSHVWRQDHNGFSHQDPGFIDHVVNKKAEIIRVYLPPDANCLLSVADHCLRSRHYVNVIVAGKQPALDYLPMDEAIIHCTRGAGIWEWASNDEGGEPDVVLGCCGDVPTLETLAAAAILREHLPDLRVRVVNVVDLMRLQPASEHPHGLSDPEFDSLFTTNRPVVFAYHGYPWLIHRLTYRRTNHGNLHVRGYKEEGTTTTPFDMVMLNDLDRFHLVIDVIDRVPGLSGGPRTCGELMAEQRLCGARLDAGARRGPSRRQRLDLALLVGRVLVVNAGSTSLKLSLVAEDETERAGRLARPTSTRRASTRSRTASSTEARDFREPVVHRRRRARGDPAARRSSRRSTTHPRCAASRTRGRASRAPSRRRLRHRLPRDHPRRGRDLRRAARAGGRSGASAATASTASRCSGRPSACRYPASSSATSAAAAP